MNFNLKNLYNHVKAKANFNTKTHKNVHTNTNINTNNNSNSENYQGNPFGHQFFTSKYHF